MLGVDDILELAKVCHIPVGENVGLKILVDNVFLVLHTVQPQGTDLLGFDPGDERLHVHERPPGTVDEDHTFFHLGEGLRVDHMVGLRHEGDVQGDDIALSVKRLQGYILCKLFYTVIFASAAAEDPAAKAGEFPDHCASDTSGPDDPYGQVFEFPSDESVQRVVVDLGAPQRLFVIAQAEKDHHDRIVGHSGGIILRVADMDPDPAGIVNIDVVVTDSTCGKTVYALLFQKIKFHLTVLVHSQDTDRTARLQPGNLIRGEHARIEDDLSLCPGPCCVEIFSFIVSYFKGIYFHFISFFLHLIFGGDREKRIYQTRRDIRFYKRYFPICNEVYEMRKSLSMRRFDAANRSALKSKGGRAMSEKIENLLNLALEASEEERERSEELDVGFDPVGNEWELIVKYSGDLDRIREIASSVTGLLNGYAVVVIREERIGALAGMDEVEFVEKPKNLYFQVENGRNASCINPVQNPPFSLSGEGVLVGIVDSGIDLTHPDFRNEDGTTRVAALWDQTLEGKPPAGYSRGSEYTAEEIERILKEEGTRSGMPLPGRDTSGHGTAVAGIAAGNGKGSEGRRLRGVAPESRLIIVKMGAARPAGFPRTTELMEGVDYIIRKAQQMRMPVAVNISFGNTYGSHDGTSLLERYLDAAADTWKNVISAGSGNEGNTAGHASGQMREGEEKEVQLAVQAREPGLNVQIWKSYVDEVEISVISPAGETAGPFRETTGAQRFLVGQTELLVYYGEPKPYSVKQEVYISFLPLKSYVDNGVWRIVLTPGRIVDGNYQMWLPVQSALNVRTEFLMPESSTTVTIPATAGRVITVGAYDALTFTYADFSGRGADVMYQGSGVPKPDLVAPGVRVQAPAEGGGYREVTGTSFAVPFVTGSAALLMEWGIVQGNDPYLYGEKVKAYLRRGAIQLPGYEKFPNAQIGYGILCVRDSIPE